MESGYMPLLLALPVPLAAIMMQQIARADRLFPVERRELDRLLKSLQAPRSSEMESAVQDFASLRLSMELRHLDWQRNPADFVDKMTAELWASSQISAFREAAKRLVPPRQEGEDHNPEHGPRCVVIALDKELRSPAGPELLFRKLRPHGAFFSVAADAHGTEALREWITARTQSNPERYAHWYLSGTTIDQDFPAPIVSFSYDGLRPTRTEVLAMFDRTRQSSFGGPDGLRQALLHVTPEDLGLGSVKDAVLKTFMLDLFTAGSGTQLYATAFVQWAVREALRRAQPQTVVAQFTARSKATSMDERLSHPKLEPAPDYAGSLVDAEMAAYMSYVNLKRLSGSKNASFLAWHEGYGQAVLVGPNIPEGTVSSSPIQMARMLSLMKYPKRVP
jgi:hypothetical protein